jgi:hypothetical protein
VAGTVGELVRTCGNYVVPVIHSPSVRFAVGGAVLAVCTAGLRLARAAWRPFTLLAVSAWAWAAIASMAVSWPVTAERVNVPFFQLWLLAAVLAVVRACELLPRRAAIAAVAALVTALALVNLPDPLNHHAWAIGLDRQLQPVRASGAPRVVVLGYHWLVYPYLHDGLVNRRADGGRYVIVAEHRDGEFRGIDAATLLAPFDLRAGDEVWCVVAEGVLPEEAQNACVLDPARYNLVAREAGERGILIGYRAIG